MKLIRIFTVTIAITFMLSFAAYAENLFYGGASAGQADFSDPCGNISGSCDDRAKGFKVYGGVQVTKNLGAEFTYVDLGEASLSTTIDGVPIGAVGHVDGFSVVGIVSYPFSPQFDVFAKAGFFSWDLEIGVTVVDVEVDSINRSGADETYGFGARFKVNDHFGLRAEWEQFKDVGDTITGETDIKLLSVGGILYF